MWGALRSTDRSAPPFLGGGRSASRGTTLEGRSLGAAFPVGQTLGQTANFRQTPPEIGVSPEFGYPCFDGLSLRGQRLFDDSTSSCTGSKSCKHRHRRPAGGRHGTGL